MAACSLDHDVSAPLAEHLRRAGHGARTAAGLGLERASDHRHLLVATLEGWALVTSGWRDFRLSHDARREWPPGWGVAPLPPHAGILVLPGAGTRPGRRTAGAAEQPTACVDGAP